MSQLHGNKKKIIGFVVLGVLALTVLVLATVKLMGELRITNATHEINNDLGLNIGKGEVLSLEKSGDNPFSTGYVASLQLGPSDIRLMRERAIPYTQCEGIPTKNQCKAAKWFKYSPDTSALLTLAEQRIIGENAYCSTLEYTVSAKSKGSYRLCVGEKKSTAIFTKYEFTFGGP